jgi:DNA-binding MarR family transcriptional regulator
VSRTIRQLIDKKLISVGVSDADGRMRNYRLTERGRELMSRLRENRSSAIEAVWGDLDRTELETFRAFSERLSQRLERFAAIESEGLNEKVLQ